jgi:hypothetical protein
MGADWCRAPGLDQRRELGPREMLEQLSEETHNLY